MPESNHRDRHPTPPRLPKQRFSPWQAFIPCGNALPSLTTSNLASTWPPGHLGLRAMRPLVPSTQSSTAGPSLRIPVQSSILLPPLGDVPCSPLCLRPESESHQRFGGKDRASEGRGVVLAQPSLDRLPLVNLPWVRVWAARASPGIASQGMVPVSSQRWRRYGKTGTGASLSRQTKNGAGLYCIGLSRRYRALLCLSQSAPHTLSPDTPSEHPLPARRQC